MTANTNKVSFRSLEWAKTSRPEWAYQHPVMQQAMRSMREAIQAREDRIMRELEERRQADALKTPEQKAAEFAAFLERQAELERLEQDALERYYGY